MRGRDVVGSDNIHSHQSNGDWPAKGGSGQRQRCWGAVEGEERERQREEPGEVYSEP